MDADYIFDRIFEIIEENGIKQPEISKDIDIYQSNISRCLNNKLYGKTLFAIMHWLFTTYNLNPAWLLLEDNGKHTKYIARKFR